MSSHIADDYVEPEVKRKRNWTTIFLPLMGFILAGLAGIVAFIISDDVMIWVQNQIPNVPKDPQSDGILQVVIGVMIFIVLLLFVAAIFALLAPKPTKMITERQLDAERKAKQREKLEMKKRRRANQIKMAKENQKARK